MPQKYKGVDKTVISKEQAEGAGARVRRSIGNFMLRNCDPFLMLDEFRVVRNLFFFIQAYSHFALENRKPVKGLLARRD